MSESADVLRLAVARRLRLRRLRWRIFAMLVVAEAAALIALARDPLMLVLLPVPATLTLVTILLLGRSRLPPEECGSGSDFAALAAILASCAATHTYLPPGRGRELSVGAELEIGLRRRFHGVRSRAEFVVVRDQDVFLILTARSYWLWFARRLRFGDVGTLAVGMYEWTDEVDFPRADDEIIGSRWQHATKNGGRDHRYRRNRMVYEVRRNGVDLAAGDLHWQIELYAYDNACTFANALAAICGQGSALVFADEEDDASDDEPEIAEDAAEEFVADEDASAGREWHDVLGTRADASVDVIRAAYRARIKEYHPDRVAHLGEKLRDLASEEALAINHAYAEAIRKHR